jgi:hypothetical protein
VGSIENGRAAHDQSGAACLNEPALEANKSNARARAIRIKPPQQSTQRRRRLARDVGSPGATSSRTDQRASGGHGTPRLDCLATTKSADVSAVRSSCAIAAIIHVRVAATLPRFGAGARWPAMLADLAADPLQKLP